MKKTGWVELVSTEPSLYLKQQIERGIIILKRGGVIAFPTDTVYGLGASSTDSRAVERIYQLKARPRHQALPLLLAKTSQISEVAQPVSQVAWQLAYKFLPGALTLVLPKRAAVSETVTAGGKTVAVRVPAHPVPQALVEGLGTPIIGTSANLSGKPPALTAGEVYSQFNGKIDLVIDGGPGSSGLESTIVDLTGGTPRILREGVISAERIKEICGNVILTTQGRVV